MVKITNPYRLYAKLDRLKPETELAVRRVLAREATKIVEAMKAACPVDTGALRDSIGWTFGRAPAKGRIPLATLSVRNDPTRVVIYAGNSKTDYVRIVEFLKKPFFWPTWRRYRSGSRNAIKLAASQGVARAMR